MPIHTYRKHRLGQEFLLCVFVTVTHESWVLLSPYTSLYVQYLIHIGTEASFEKVSQSCLWSFYRLELKYFWSVPSCTLATIPNEPNKTLPQNYSTMRKLQGRGLSSFMHAAVTVYTEATHVRTEENIQLVQLLYRTPRTSQCFLFCDNRTLKRCTTKEHKHCVPSFVKIHETYRAPGKHIIFIILWERKYCSHCIYSQVICSLLHMQN